MLLDALDGVALSDGGRASLVWAGFDAHTVENVAAVIARALRTRGGAAVAWNHLLAEVSAPG